ncbi:MAG TPA: DUF4058 family protein [Pirellulales bacterium]|nr:DUF4058 family protein [Pirellulales bacterium]
MPIHDWKRVPPGIFHDFHQEWSVALKHALNGILPPPYYALIEQAKSGRYPGVLTFQTTETGKERDDEGSGLSRSNGEILTLAEDPPRVSITAVIEADVYAEKANRVVVLNDADEVIAVLEVVSPGNKANLDGFNQFVDKALQFIRTGIHFFFIDLFPPTSRDPQGLHAAIWSEMTEYDFQLPDGKPLTVASYSCGVARQAFMEAVAVGDPLPAMPLFLQADRYVLVPLEATYQLAFDALPKRWRDVLAPS